MSKSAGSTRPQRRVSLTFTLTVSIGLLVLISVCSVMAIGFNTSRRNTLDLLGVQSATLVGNIEAAIRNHLDPVSEQVQFVENLVTTGILDPGNETQLVATMLGSLAAAPQIMATVHWDKNYQKTVAFRAPDIGIGTEKTDDSGKPDIIEFLELTAQASDPTWGPLRYESEIGETFVNLTTPLRHDGNFVGVMGTAIGMQELSFLMAGIGLRLEATPFILHGSEQVLAHPLLTSGHSSLTPDTPTVPIAELGDPTLALIGQRQPVRALSAATADLGFEVASIPRSTGNQIIFTKQISGYSDTTWLIGAYLPAQQVTAELLRLREAALAALVLLILAIAAAITLARFIARPIRRAAAGANRVAQLQLRDVTPMPGSFIREINEQATAFNTMLGGLRWFETYVPRRLVARLMASEDEHAPTDERELTIMFTDIVGFTTMSESMSATATKELLNEHFATLGQAIEDQGGTIDKYIGDAVMAFWGAPDNQPDHAARACHAAQAIAQSLTTSNAERHRRGEPPVRIRIGIHTGPAVVGNIGAPGRINYTAVGDTVNTSQRLEALGKRLPDDNADVVILISTTTAKAWGNTTQLTPMGKFELAGKHQSLEVLRLAN